MNDSLESSQSNSNLPIEDGNIPFSPPPPEKQVSTSIPVGTPSTDSNQQQNSQEESPKQEKSTASEKKK